MRLPATHRDRLPEEQNGKNGTKERQHTTHDQYRLRADGFESITRPDGSKDQGQAARRLVRAPTTALRSGAPQNE